jgi:hypothetical protein
MYCYTKKNYRSPPAQNLLVETQYDKKGKKFNYIPGETPVSHINILQKETAVTLETNEQIYSEIPCERTNHNFERIISSSYLPTGFSLFFFRLSTIPLPPPSPFYIISLAVSFSSQQIFVTTCILLLPYFIIHGRQAGRQASPLLAHYLYASRYQTPHSPSCMRLLSSLIPSRFVTVTLTHKYIS